VALEAWGTVYTEEEQASYRLPIIFHLSSLSFSETLSAYLPVCLSTISDLSSFSTLSARLPIRCIYIYISIFKNL